MSEEEKSKQGSKSGSSAKKKEEEPPIEDKPFAEFIEQHYEPALKLCRFWDGGKRRFNVYFLDDDISGQKAFSYTASDSPPSTIESFMIDERKVNLELLVMYTVQRLNGQKWLARN